MLRLALLSALLALATAAPVATSQATLRPEVPDLRLTPCDYCQKLVKTLDTFANDPDTQKAVEEYIDAAVCAGLPDQFAEMCTQEVPVLVAQAASIIQQALDPEDTCALIGVCPGASAAQLLGVQAGNDGSPWDCPVCKMVVVAFVERLKDRKERQQIEADMRAACDNLAPEAKARCLTDVANLFSALDNLLQDVDPEGVCRVAEFCGDGGAAAAPAALRALRGALAQLAVGAPARGPANDMCDNCKTIVTEAAAILQDPKTQLELLEYAKEGCSIFADFKDQCEQYVTLYGPLVFNMLISYLQPDSLCARIGYCPAPPPALVA